MKVNKLLPVSLFSVLATGCIVMPNVTTEYSERCQAEKKKIILTIEQEGEFGTRNCNGDHDCKAMFVGHIAGAAIIFPVSAIVSGSIALVGNTLYWLQERQCTE